MIAATVWFLLGLLLLALGGDSIVKAASGLAQRFGASPFVAGLLLVAFGTSLPELVVNARAFVVGAEDLALGNAVGSNIVNVGLTLGMAALAAASAACGGQPGVDRVRPGRGDRALGRRSAAAGLRCGAGVRAARGAARIRTGA
jgi:hypothetical protein